MGRLRVTHGIYGAECALGMQGFCSFDYRCFPIFLENVDKRINLMPIAMHPMITKPTEDELIHLHGDFYMTTPERSIIDMLRVSLYRRLYCGWNITLNSGRWLISMECGMYLKEK